MADYGSTVEPGIVTDVSSALTVSTAGASPADVGFVGQADLGGGSAQGSANPNEVYRVTRSNEARTYFGDDSILTEAIVDALNEDAFPIYAVAAAEQTVTDEDISGASDTTIPLANAPLSEDIADITVTIDGTTLSGEVVYDDVSTYSPAAGEYVVNPVTATIEVDALGSDADDTNDTVDYTHYDYPSGHQALVDGAAEAVDFFVPLSENDSVTSDAQTKVNNMAQEYNFALAIVGAGARLDVSSYSNSFDDSRVQVIYPTRDEDDYSILGAYAGKRAALGIQTTPINKRLDGEKKLAVAVPKDKRGELIQKFVTPLAQETRGARIADDVNSVSDSNSEESNIRYGFSRLVVDYLLNVVRTNEEPFIGKLNALPVRNALQGLLNSQMRPLKRTNSVIDFNIEVQRVDATTATVEMGVETAKPLRFIENEITVGGVK